MKITVVTATYNCVRTIADCIRSVAEQTWAEREHVVVDGASRDGTLEVLERNRDRLAVLISEPDRGIYDALNKGIAHSSGDVIGFLHADDVFSGPDVLAWVAEAFNDPAVDAVYGDLLYVARNDTTRVIRYWRSSSYAPGMLSKGWMPPHPTLYLRRDVYRDLGGFDTSYRIAADYEFILRLFTRPGLRAVYIPRVMVKMRIGGTSNRSLAQMVRKSAEDWRAMREHRIGGVTALVWKNLSKVGQFLRPGPDLAL